MSAPRSTAGCLYIDHRESNGVEGSPKRHDIRVEAPHAFLVDPKARIGTEEFEDSSGSGSDVSGKTQYLTGQVNRVDRPDFEQVCGSADKGTLISSRHASCSRCVI